MSSSKASHFISGTFAAGSSLVRALLFSCFMAFPLFLLYTEIERHNELGLAARKSQLQQQAQQKLVDFIEAADDTRFFHLLLQRTFSKIHQTGNLNADLLKRIARLKKAFPDTFSFIVWDKTGNPIASLSDDNRFNFLQKKLYRFWHALLRQTRSTSGAALESEPLEKELRMLRQFLGPFVPLGHLAKPFLDGTSASCFQMHGRGERYLGWVRATENYSIQVYISDRIKNRLIGPRVLQKFLTGKIPFIEFYLLDEVDQQIYPLSGERLSGEIMVNFGKLKSFTPAGDLESADHFFSYQMLNSRWWIAACIEKKGLGAFEDSGGRAAARTIAALLILAMVLHCFFLTHRNPFNSVTWKLAAVFAYTVFIPAAVFSLLGLDYLSQMEIQVVNNKAVQAFNLLTSIDRQFKGFLQTRATGINQDLTDYFQNREVAKIAPGEFKSIAEELSRRYFTDSITISDPTGNDLLQSAYSKTIKDQFLRKTAAKELIAYLNGHNPDQQLQNMTIAEGFILQYALSIRNIVSFTLNNTTFLAYLNTLRGEKNGDFVYLIQAFWRENMLQEEFFTRVLDEMPLLANRQLLLYFPDARRVIPGDGQIEGLGRFLEQVAAHGTSKQKLLRSDGHEFFAYGIKGTNLNEAVLAVLFDHQQLISEISGLRSNIWLLALTSLLMTLGLYKLLSFQVIEPVQALTEGIEMVKHQNFSFRIGNQTGNELGRLSQSIDNTLENLQELEIARTVQESLLPQSSLEIGEFMIRAETRSMSTLGGDYHDFVVDEQQNGIILLADVAGHGVQAALLMSMAKAVMLLHQNDRLSPELLMEKLNATFYTLRKSAIKTMMTGQMFAINGNTSEIRYLNAGHCPPMLVSDQGRTITPQNFHTLPFGFMARRSFESQPLNLEPGQMLILYTDGIIEGLNDKNVPLGEAGFIELIRRSYSQCPDTFLSSLFKACQQWSPVQRDDVTFVLIARRGNDR